jgi:hypothetical protein
MTFFVLAAWALLISCGYLAGRHQRWALVALAMALAVAGTLGALQPWNDQSPAPTTEEERIQHSDKRRTLFILLGINCGIPLGAAALGWGFRVLEKREEERR